MYGKKSAVMLYPYCSLQEVTCLTSALTLWDDHEGAQIVTFASTRDILRSEDGFQLAAEHTFDEFRAQDYDCLLLPGILNPMPALFDPANIGFLRSLRDPLENGGLVLAAISSAPLLLAKAGLLDDHTFVCGVWDEVLQYLGFVPKQNIRHVPLLRDGNIVTAIGFAFREFATEVLRAVGCGCKNTVFPGVDPRGYSEEELTYKMGEENFKEFLEEYNGYIDREGKPL